MAPSPQSPEAEGRFDAAIRRFDAENGQDPNRVCVGGSERPRELVYSEWLTAWVLRLAPDASEALRLAARCQHLCRWTIPRASYPLSRSGYLRWRQDLKQFHAGKSATLLREVGYPEAVVERVRALNLKQGFPDDPEVRVLEDALCLVFLERQLPELVERTEEGKLVNALAKSWAKMSPQGRAEVGRLPLQPREQALLARALAQPPAGAGP